MLAAQGVLPGTDGCGSNAYHPARALQHHPAMRSPMPRCTALVWAWGLLACSQGPESPPRTADAGVPDATVATDVAESAEAGPDAGETIDIVDLPAWPPPGDGGCGIPPPSLRPPGPLSFPTGTFYPIEADMADVHLADMNGDGKLDVVINSFTRETADQGRYELEVRLGLGEGKVRPGGESPTGGQPRSASSPLAI